MLIPLALLISVAVLITTGSVIRDRDEIKHVRDVRETFPGIGEYSFYPELVRWHEGFEYCARNGGQLAVINSVAEKQALLTMMARHGVNITHLGIMDRFTEGEYYTINNEPLDAACGGNDWAPGHPLNDTLYTCGGLTREGIVNTNCPIKQASICEYPKTNDYDLIPGHGYYKYHQEIVSWYKAWHTCQSEGAYLHILNSLAEKEALYDLYNMQEHVWTGVHRMYSTTDDRWVTIFNQPLANIGFTTWEPNHPAGTYLGSPCTEYLGIGNLRSNGCGSNSFHFICEIDI